MKYKYIIGNQRAIARLQSDQAVMISIFILSIDQKYVSKMQITFFDITVTKY